MSKARDDNLPQHHLGQGHWGDLDLDELPDATGFPSGTAFLWDGSAWYYGSVAAGPGSDQFFEVGPIDNPKLLPGLTTIYSEDAGSYIFLGGGNYVEIGDALNEWIFMDANGKINMNSDFGIVLPMRATDPGGGDSEVSQIYYHSGSHTIRRYDGASWDDVGGAGSDDKKVMVSSNDTTPNYLLNKLVAGTDITIVENNNGSNETITINSTASGSGGLGAWTTYTPTWTASTTNPTLGSTTITGRYKLLDAKTVAVQINIVITTGGAWNAGSGTYAFSLPAGMTGATRHQIGATHIRDSGTVHYTAVCSVRSGATTIGETYVADSSGTHLFSNTVPITLATNDEINMSILIEIQ